MKIGSGDVASLYIGENEASAAYIGSDLVWENGYWGLRFTAEQANSTVGMEAVGSAPAVTLKTSTDGKTWTTYTVGTTITLTNVGDKVYFAAGAGGNTRMGSSSSNYNKFSITGLVAASGNIMSLLDADVELTTITTDYCFDRLFSACTSLTTAPELPATTLATSCYQDMFVVCTSLTTAPELPATTLASRCYNNMFQSCSSLTQAPALPATTLAARCYSSMFRGCSSLTQAPALPATTLAAECYLNMFDGCTSLTTAPALPATTLATTCYQSMFSGCTSLTTAPTLPATTLVTGCYSSMFRGCSSLTQAPRLPATTPAYNCYNNMFDGCTQLQSVRIAATSSSSFYFYNWLNNVAATGTFYCPSTLGTNETIARGASACPTGWTVVNTDYQGLCFTAEQANSTIMVKKQGSTAPTLTLVTSTDGETWTSYTVGDTITLVNVGDTVYFAAGEGGNATWATATARYNMFSGTGRYSASGNIMTLLDKDDPPTAITTANCFARLFNGNTALTAAPRLPATTLANNCYYQMFNGCTSLTTAPEELPATTLANNCYYQMFNGCTSLTTAPELPATTMTQGCYYQMFNGCTSLTTAPELPATTLAQSCYMGMFSGCTSLTTAPELPATTLATSCYLNMFDGCTSLTTAPALPATTLATTCYQGMFYGCSQLGAMEVEFTDWNPADATTNWLYGVAASGTFKCPSELGTDETITRGASYCPTGWTVPSVVLKNYINTNVAEMNTGHVPTVNTRVTGRFRGHAVGNWFVGNEGALWRFFTAGNGSSFYVDVNGMGARINVNSGWDITKWYDVDVGNFYFTCTPVDGGTTLSQTSTPRSFTHTNPLKLGSATYQWAGEYERFDCAGFKIYESGTLVKDYVPAVDGSNVACFYETLSGTYVYPSSGTFLAY